MRVPPIVVAFGGLSVFAALVVLAVSGAFLPGLALLALGLLLPASVRQAQNWEHAVLLRFGKFVGMRGPGLFLVVPGVDEVAVYVDDRIRTTEIKAESALTKDTVAVNVDAVVFWQVHDAEKAALEIDDYEEAVERVSQTSMREMIGASDLTKLMSDRKAADVELKAVIGDKIREWGLDVKSVEIRDVAIPAALHDAMSRVAQAERERDARVTLADAEVQIARKTREAADIYDTSPTALKLRQMSLTFEIGRRGTTILIPTELSGSMSGAATAMALDAAGKADAPPAADKEPARR